MPMITAKGIEFYYRVHGDGEPVLLIAGFGCDHTIWTRVAPGLAARHQVIVFDNRGIGRTISPNVSTDVSQLAHDTAEMLDALGVGPTHVVGHSLGGMIAQELALSRPELVRSLAVLSSSARLDARGRAVITSWGNLPFRVDAATLTQLIVPWIYTSRFFEKPGAVAQIIDQIMANPYPPKPEVLYAQSQAITGFDTSNRLDRIDCPTLVLTGREDILVPVALSERLARGIRGAKLVVLEGTGHGLLVESPDAVIAALLDFLSRQSH